MKRALAIGSLFFLSGLTSLVYEAIWIRVLSLGVGSTSTSMSIVLGIFFAGLSFGSWGAGKLAPRIQRPIFCYGVIEGVIGAYSLLLLPVLFEFHSLLGLLPLSGSFSWLGTLLKFVLVLLLLAVPTTLMGASLPILIRIFVQSEKELGRRISLLYGVNTLGAVAGAFLSGFVLIPALGIISSNSLAAVLNFLILGAAFLIQRQEAPLAPLTLSPAQVAGKTDSPFGKLLPWIAAGTGFSALAAEVVWSKYLGIFLGSNIFGLSLILSLFLLGIALGSFALSLVVEKVARKERLFQWLLVVCALAIFLTTRLLNLAPVMANVTSYYFPSMDLFVLKALFAAVILFPPGAILGALLPLAIRLKIENAGASATVAGRLYALNTIGSIAGSCAAGLVLIPLFGSGGAVLLSVALLLVLSLATCLVLGRDPRQRAVLAVAHILVLALVPFVSGIRFENIIKSAYFQQAAPNLSFADAMRYFARDYEEFQLIVEGKTGIISLSHDPQDGPNYKDYLRLKTNGLNESIYDLNNLDVLPKYEALLGFLPLALSRNPESAFIVGYGGGYTVNFLTSTDMDRVLVAELEEGILEAASYVYKGNNPLLKRKNLELEIEDARFLLSSRSRGPFDIIVSQPSHSWLAGVANLFTEEFFVAVKDNLSPNGVFSQWLNLYNMNPQVLRSILHTFFSVFPHGFVFTGAGDQELILIGSQAPLRFDLGKLEAMARNENYRRQLSYVPVRNAYDVLALFALSRNQALTLTEGARKNTDRNAFAEVTQSRLFYSERNPFPSRFLLEAFAGDYSDLVRGGEGVFQSTFYRGLLQALESERPRSFKVLPILDRLRELNQQQDAFEIAHQAYQMERYATAEEILTPLLRSKPSPEAFLLSLNNYLLMGERAKAQELWRRLPRFRGGSAACLGLELNADSESDQIAARLEKNYEANLSLCGAYLNKALGLYHLQKGHAARAASFLEAYYTVAPGDVPAYRALLASYILSGDQENSRNFFAFLGEMVAREKSRLEDLAAFYERKGFARDAEVLRRKASQL